MKKQRQIGSSSQKELHYGNCCSSFMLEINGGGFPRVNLITNAVDCIIPIIHYSITADFTCIQARMKMLMFICYINTDVQNIMTNILKMYCNNFAIARLKLAFKQSDLTIVVEFRNSFQLSIAINTSSRKGQIRSIGTQVFCLGT
jgi:hypothetical protein